MAKKFVAARNFHHGTKRGTDEKPGHAGHHVKKGAQLDPKKFEEEHWDQLVSAGLVSEVEEVEPKAEKAEPKSEGKPEKK